MEESRIRPIFVLGIDRSGTSLLAEVVHRWGAYAGEAEHLPEANDGNPQGYWEYGPMENFGTDLMASVEISVWHPDYKQRMRQKASDPQWRDRALKLADGMARSGRQWFWKEPHLVYALPFWGEIFPDPICLVTLRNPCESATSFQKFFLPSILRDKVKLSGYFFLLWQYTMTTLCEHLKSSTSKLLVPYESLLSSPDRQCERIAQFLAVESGSPKDDNIQRMVETVDPGCWRNRSSISFLEAEMASQAQKDLYSYLLDRSDGDWSDFDEECFPFPGFWREYVTNFEVFRWLLKNL